jgi:hypothetical protein
VAWTTTIRHRAAERRKEWRPETEMPMVMQTSPLAYRLARLHLRLSFGKIGNNTIRALRAGSCRRRRNSRKSIIEPKQDEAHIPAARFADAEIDAAAQIIKADMTTV